MNHAKITESILRVSQGDAKRERIIASFKVTLLEVDILEIYVGSMAG